MYGTEYGRKNGSYSTATIGTWELVRQDTANNYSVIRSHLYFYYGGGTRVKSTYSSFGTMGVTLQSGGYTFTPGTHHLGSTDFTVYHNADGTFPQTNIGFWANSAHMSEGEVWGTIGYRAVPDIPRQANITRCDNFNSNGNPYMEFTNPGGFKLNLRLEFGGTSISRNSYYGSGGYTFQLTESERNLLYSKCSNGNSLTVRYVVATCIGGGNETHWSYIDRTMTVVNSNPEFNYFEFEDVSEKTTLLTGNPKSIIKGYSEVLISIPVANKATAKNYATMSKYRGKIGELTVDIPYSEDAIVGGRIKNAPSSTITCYAIDSRNNSTVVEKQAENFINYIPVTKGNITVSRNNGVSEEVKLKIDGNYNAINFGVVINSIKTSKYRFKTKENTEWSDYENFEISTGATGENGSFSFDGFIKGDTETFGFNISNSYMFEVLIEDELSSVIFTANLGSGIPNIALAKNGVGIMGKYDDEVGGLLQVGGKDITKKAIATAYLSSNLASYSGKISLDAIISNSSNLILYDGGIKIGKGISYVSVSGNAFVQAERNDSYLWTAIRCNSTEISIALSNYNTYFTSTSHSPRAVKVKEGDIIYLWQISEAPGQLRSNQNTYLTVEVIGEDF